jgi:hypothetical protein
MNFKPLTFLALVLGLSSGCATFTPERHVTGYTLTSSDPSLAIAVSPSFEYLGNIKDRRWVKSTLAGYNLRVDDDAYVFVIREPGKP